MKLYSKRKNNKNPKSVQNGYGPVCWIKLNNTAYDERPTSLRITITDEIEAGGIGLEGHNDNSKAANQSITHT